MRGERILVTGGAGFTGSGLAEVLAEGSDVVILDNSSTERLDNVKLLKKSTLSSFDTQAFSDQRNQAERTETL